MINVSGNFQYSISKTVGGVFDKITSILYRDGYMDIRTHKYKDSYRDRQRGGWTDRLIPVYPQKQPKIPQTSLLHNKSCKLSQNTPFLPQVVTIHEISWP